MRRASWMTSVFAVVGVLAGCSGSEQELDCEDAQAILSSCVTTDGPQCADDAAASQLVLSGTCQVDGKADWFGNKSWGQSCRYNWQCSATQGLSCNGGTCFERAQEGNNCDVGDSADCEAGLSCARDLSTPAAPGICSLTGAAVVPALYAETPRPNEQAEFEQAAVDVMNIMLKLATDRASGDDQIRRGFHAKPHACVRGQFEVVSDIPEAFRVGPVFGRPRSFPAFIRFSNGLGVVHPDKKTDVRGLAVKIVGVDGPKLLGGADASAVTQDFLMINQPGNFARNTKETIEFAKAEAHGTQASFLLRHLRIAKVFAAMALRGPIDSVRTETYWAGGAYRFGDKAMKYLAKPCAGTTSNGPGLFPTDGYLKRELVDHLPSGVCFDFYVQLQTDPVNMSIEDASSVWDEELSAPVRVGRLTMNTVPDATFEAACNKLSFTPWHSAPEYKPLGNTNRGRRFTYDASRMYRGSSPEPTSGQL